MNKICSTCLISKDVSEFYRNSRNKDGLYSRCKHCHNHPIRKNTKRDEQNALLLNGRKRCGGCKEVKEVSAFSYYKRSRDNLHYYCRECNSKRCREWQSKNAEALQHYRSERRVRIKDKTREYQRRNRENINKQSRERYAQDRDRCRAVSRITSNRYWARKKGASGNYSTAEAKDLYERQRGLCAYCNIQLEDVFSYTGKQGSIANLDHIVPVSRGGSNSIGNLAWACKSCNCSKRDLLLSEWTPPVIERYIENENDFLLF